MRLAAALLLLAVSSAAEPSPREVLARAKRGRVEFIRAVSDVGRFAPRLASKEALYPYIELLDELAAAGRGYDLETMGVDPVRDLGADLTRAAEKWLRLDRDSPAFVRAFLKWSANDTRITAAGDAGQLAAEASGGKELLAWNAGARAALDALGAMRPERSAVQAFDELQGVTARLLVTRRSELAPGELEGAIRDVASAPGLSELLVFLDVALGQARDTDSRARVLDWALLVASAARKLPAGAPMRLRADADALIADAVERSLYEGDALAPRAVDAALDELTPSRAADLLMRVGALYADRPAPVPQAACVRRLALGVAARHPWAGANRRPDIQALAR